MKPVITNSEDQNPLTVIFFQTEGLALTHVHYSSQIVAAQAESIAKAIHVKNERKVQFIGAYEGHLSPKCIRQKVSIHKSNTEELAA
ncbi:hypothetical protein AB6D11_00155 [Vibrio splendidus]